MRSASVSALCVFLELCSQLLKLSLYVTGGLAVDPENVNKTTRGPTDSTWPSLASMET